ncbi:MAG: preprotein translocase subunit SecG [bacterium]
MLTFLIFLYVISIVVMIVSILMQSGRGSGLSGAFGSSWESGMIFGGRGATEFLTKITTGAAIVFAVLSIIINIYITRPRTVSAPHSVVKERTLPQATPTGEEERIPQSGTQQPAGK